MIGLWSGSSSQSYNHNATKKQDNNQQGKLNDYSNIIIYGNGLYI